MRLLVIYDQDCGVCSASVDWIRRRDPDGSRFEFLGNLGALPTSVSAAETLATVVVLEDRGGGEKWVRAQAVSKILRALGPGYRALGQALRLPLLSWLADFGYRQLARRRHLVSARLGLKACKVRGPGTTKG